MNKAEAANTGNGCTGCHDVHRSTVANEEPFREECTECHEDIDIATIAHNGGPGTPMEFSGAKACESCHMPHGVHLWRINTDAAYSTFPMPAALSGTVNATTADHDGYTNAVWTDVDLACGQCHGGGTAKVSTTGSTVTVPSLALDKFTVANVTGFVIGQRVIVKGAGALYYDDLGTSYREDFESYVKAIDIGNKVLTMAGKSTTAVTGKAVVQNPTTTGAPYYTKSYLANLAKGMHDQAPVTYSVTFSTSVTPNTLTVNTDASVACGGACIDDFKYEWIWGDGQPNTTTTDPVDTSSHAYAVAGTKTITLNVYTKTDNKLVGSSIRNVTITNPDLPPTVAGTCTYTADTWTVTVQDASTDDGPDADALPGDGESTLEIMVEWGDGSKSFGKQGALYSHTYTRLSPPAFTVTQRATDLKQQMTSRTCGPYTVAYFEIKGTVTNKANVPLGGASVTILKGTTPVRTVTTLANGTFTTGLTMKPGTYNLRVVKTGYPFTYPAAGPQAVGPSWTGIVIKSTN